MEDLDILDCSGKSKHKTQKIQHIWLALIMNKATFTRLFVQFRLFAQITIYVLDGSHVELQICPLKHLQDFCICHVTHQQ